MKRQLFTLVGALALFLVGGPAFGQTISLRADVPFDFIVSGKTLPAGKYTIPSNPTGKVLAVQNLDSGRTVMVSAGNDIGALNSPEEFKLVFHQYGQLYFLSQVWEGGYTGHELLKSNRETEVSMDYPLRSAIVVPVLR